MYSRPTVTSFDELNKLIDKTANKASKEFDDLVSTLGINVKQNEEWAKQYYDLVKQCDKLSKKINRQKVWRWILIIFLIFPYFLITSSMKKNQATLDKLLVEKDKLKAQLDKQIADLKSLLSYDFTFNKIISPTWPELELNLFMDKADGACWQDDLESYIPNNTCATSLVSGKLFEHPFAMFNRKDQGWHPRTYTGSVPVSYTTTVNGRTEFRTTVVVATVTLPEPDWSYDTKLVYKTSYTNKLEFTTNINKKEFKKWDKQKQTPFENKEFNKLCPIIRNDEQQIRVLFTPLAQENYVNMLKERKYWITKQGDYTMVDLPNDKFDFLIDIDYDDEFNYDILTWKKQYINWVKSFVNTIGVYSLPIVNIPVYRQMSYKWTKPLSEASAVQSQSNIVYLVERYGLKDLFETDVIYRLGESEQIKIGKHTFDLAEIKCHYFHPHHRIQMEVRPSPKGPVSVPVPVIDYLPRIKILHVLQSTDLKVNKELDTENYSLHSGQLLVVSSTPIKGTKTIDIVEEAIKDM